MNNIDHEQVAMEAARQEAIQKGWKKFRFPDEPPRPGTPVEQRMIDTAERYINLAFSRKLRGKNSASEGVKRASESEQRVLHNQLAIMIFGEARTGMKYDTATAVKDFAASIAHPGFSTEQIYEMLNSDDIKEE